MKRLNNQEIWEVLLNGDQWAIDEVLKRLHPVDLLEVLEEHEDEAGQVLNRLSDELLADLIDEAEDEDKYEILKQFSILKQKHILSEMSNDEIADLVEQLEDDEAEDVLANLDEEDRQDIERLMQYDPDSAGGIMTSEYLSLPANFTVGETLTYLQVHTDVETTYYLYVVDKHRILKGVVSLRDLVTHPFHTKITDILNPNVIAVKVDEDQEQVAHQFEKYGFILMPVVDEQGRMLGVIEFDDIMDVLSEEYAEDIHHLAGINKEEKIDSSIADSFKSRIPWLIVNLLTAVLAAAVVAFFESTIAQVVSLATVMSIVTGMGGNAGTQALTIVVRGISLNELTKENGLKILGKEIVVGMMSGLVIGIFVGIGSSLLEMNPFFGVITGAAMFLNMILANIAGYFIPVILTKLKVDPALASGVFVTTVTDVMGFMLFLGLASLALPYLV